MKKVFSIRYKIFIIYSLLIICILLFTSVITNQMTSNTSVENAVETSERELALIINNLDAKITHIYDYATTVAVNPDSKDEMAILYTGFNNLTKKVRALLDEVYQKQEEKNQYQLQLIQSQVKPHFLYNTLETIKSLVDLDLNETASEAISAMAVFYRISLNNGNDMRYLSRSLRALVYQ